MFLDSACICLHTIYWSQVFSGEWRCSWSSADRRCSNYIWVINNVMAFSCASYIRVLTVTFIVITVPADDLLGARPSVGTVSIKSIYFLATPSNSNRRDISVHGVMIIAKLKHLLINSITICQHIDLKYYLKLNVFVLKFSHYLDISLALL